MSADEVIAVYKSEDREDKLLWERHRQACFYTVIAMNGTRDYKSPHDLFPIPWDEDYAERIRVEDAPLTREQFFEQASKLIGNV